MSLTELKKQIAACWRRLIGTARRKGDERFMEDEPTIPRGKFYMKINDPSSEARFLRRFYRFNKAESSSTLLDDPNNPGKLIRTVYNVYDFDLDAVVAVLRADHLKRLRSQIEPLALKSGVMADQFEDWLFTVLPFFDLDESDDLICVDEKGMDLPTRPADLIEEMKPVLAWAYGSKLSGESPVLPDGHECQKDFSRDERLSFIGQYGVNAWQSVPREGLQAMSRTAYLLQTPSAKDFARSFAAEKAEAQKNWEKAHPNR